MIDEVRPAVAALAVMLLFATPARAQRDVEFQAYQAQIAAAEKSLQLNDSREIRRWLDAADSARRGWEWKHLSAVADTALRRVATTETPIRVTMSPGGDTLATVQGASVRLLSWPSLEKVAVIEGHEDAVYRAEFSPDGSRLITVSRDVTSRTWDIASGEEVARIELANPAFAAATFDPAGTTAATCAWERDESGDVHGVVWVWDPATSEILQRRRVGVKPLSSIRYGPDGSRIVVGSWDGLVHVLDAQANDVRTLELPDEGIYNAVNDVALSADGRFVVAASKDRTARVFDLESGEEVAALRGHGGYVEGVAYSPDGSLLATSSGDSTAALWDTATWTRRSVLRGAAETVRGAAWSLDGDRVIACSLDGHLHVWDAAVNDESAVEIHIEAEGIYSTSLSAEDAIAVACHDGRVLVVDSRSGEVRMSWEAHPGSTCHAAGFSADGRRLVTASWDKTARVWDPRDGSLVSVLEAGEGVYFASISPDGSRVATSGDTVQVWEVDGAQRLHTILIEGAGAGRLAFSSDGALLASGWTDGSARVHRTDDAALVVTLGGGATRVEAVAFLPGNVQVVTGDGAGVVRLFSVSGGEATFTIDTGGRGVNHIDAGADRIAIATDQLWLIDPAQGDIVLGLRPHADTIWHLAWSPDGKRLATCAIGGVIKILDG